MLVRKRLVVAAFLSLLAACGSADSPSTTGISTGDIMRATHAQSAGNSALTLTGNQSQYTIAASGSGFTVTDNVAGTSQTVSAQTRLNFADGTVALDLNGLPGQAYRMYQAAFNRQPDSGGLGFQINALDAGFSLEQIAQNFIDSPEFKATYGALDTNAFVTTMYLNVLGRKPDDSGLMFYVSHLDGSNADGIKFSRAQVLKGFSESPENKTLVLPAIASGVAYTRFGTTAPSNPASEFAGDYSGSYRGGDSGTLVLKLASDGSITAIAHSTSLDLDLRGTGSVAAGGKLTVTLTATGRLSTFSGSVNKASGLATGSFQPAGAGGSGVFNATLLANPEYVVDTVVGEGSPSLGDGGLATDAILSAPERVVMSSSGAVYIVDTNNERIRLVETNGVIRTFAGTGSAENQALGDGGPATQAVVRFPRSLADTPDGVYIGDHSYTVRFVDKTGTIRHFALQRSAPVLSDVVYPWALAVDAAGNVYIADATHHRVLRADPTGAVTTLAGTGEAGTSGDGGAAAQARIDSPTDLKLDAAGRLLVGSANAPLRQIDLATGLISTRLPQQMAYFDLAPNGDLLYARDQRVFRVNPATGAEAAIAGTGVHGFSGDGGAATAAQLNEPKGIAADRGGNIYIADSGNNRVRRIGANGTITTFAGSGAQPALQHNISDTQGMAVDKLGNLFFTDFQYHYLKRLGVDGAVSIVAGNGVQTSSGDGGPALIASFSNPCKIAFDRGGRLYFLDLTRGTGAVRMIAPGSDGVVNGGDGEVITTVAGQNVPRDFTDHGSADGGPARSAVFNGARYFLFAANGKLIVSDWLDHRIRMVTPGADGIFNGGDDEIITTIAGNGSTGQSGDGGLATHASLEAPTRMAIDAAGNLYVFAGVNTAARAIRRIDAQTGLISTIASGIDLVDMVINKSNELIYTTNSQVVKLDLTTRRSSIIAGTGGLGFSGDGADARYATFKGASYLALDAADNIYVADNGNFRIRRLSKRR